MVALLIALMLTLVSINACDNDDTNNTDTNTTLECKTQWRGGKPVEICKPASEWGGGCEF